MSKRETYWTRISHISGSEYLWGTISWQAKDGIKAIHQSYLYSWCPILSSTVSDGVNSECEKPHNFLDCWHRDIKSRVCWSRCRRDLGNAISTGVIGCAGSYGCSGNDCICQKCTVWIAVAKLSNRVNSAYILNQFMIISSCQRQNRWRRHRCRGCVTGYGICAQNCIGWNELSSTGFLCDDVKVNHLWLGVVVH